jgi:hypothetical protein
VDPTGVAQHKKAPVAPGGSVTQATSLLPTHASTARFPLLPVPALRGKATGAAKAGARAVGAPTGGAHHAASGSAAALHAVSERAGTALSQVRPPQDLCRARCRPRGFPRARFPRDCSLLYRSAGGAVCGRCGRWPWAATR